MISQKKRNVSTHGSYYMSRVCLPATEHGTRQSFFARSFARIQDLFRMNQRC